MSDDRHIVIKGEPWEKKYFQDRTLEQCKKRLKGVLPVNSIVNIYKQANELSVPTKERMDKVKKSDDAIDSDEKES